MTEVDAWTTKDAADNLDPEMSMLEVRKMIQLARIPSIGRLRARPPAKVYRASDIQRAHALICDLRAELGPGQLGGRVIE